MALTTKKKSLTHCTLGMIERTGALGNSAAEEALLRPAALWAADCAALALPAFVRRAPNDERPQNAVVGGREFGQGKRRDTALRTLAWAAHSAAKEAKDKAAEYAARSAMLTAAVAYTHTDLAEGLQGIRQARHLLGPVVYAALALELDETSPTDVANDVISFAVRTAPPEILELIRRMPPQQPGPTRLGQLFYALDAELRAPLSDSQDD
jgi:hypothetical protein